METETVKKTNNYKGGNRQIYAEKMIQCSFRMTKEQYKKCIERGGSAYLRKLIEADNSPEK